uniref:Uncharacterized protein n=1 Tax=Rhizophora mucronata TaxID=61149 RepID=A0A2P2JSZ3_RHIMU
MRLIDLFRGSLCVQFGDDFILYLFIYFHLNVIFLAMGTRV